MVGQGYSIYISLDKIMNKLYKVKVETDIMVLADSESSAIEVAKKNSPSEIGVYGRGIAYVIKSLSDIPEDWKSIIPYSREGVQETRKCFELVSAIAKEVPRDDIEEIMKIKNSAVNPSVIQSPIEIKPETRPDPKPKELDWHETKSGRPMKALRFVR